MKKFLSIISVLAIGASANSLVSTLNHIEPNNTTKMQLNSSNKDIKKAFKIITDVVKNTKIDGHQFKAGEFYRKSGANLVVMSAVGEVVNKVKQIAIDKHLENIIKLFRKGYIIIFSTNDFRLHKGKNIITYSFMFQNGSEERCALKMNLMNVQ